MFFKPLALPFDPGSAAPGHALTDNERPTWRGLGAWASALRLVIVHAKAGATMHPQFRALREGPFSLERGLNTVYVFFKLSIILCGSSWKLCPTTKKATRLGSPSLELLCG